MDLANVPGTALPADRIGAQRGLVPGLAHAVDGAALGRGRGARDRGQVGGRRLAHRQGHGRGGHLQRDLGVLPAVLRGRAPAVAQLQHGRTESVQLPFGNPEEPPTSAEMWLHRSRAHLERGPLSSPPRRRFGIVEWRLSWCQVEVELVSEAPEKDV